MVLEQGQDHENSFPNSPTAILMADAASRAGTFKNLKSKQEKKKNTIQQFWLFFLIVIILVIWAPCGPTPLSIQHKSREGWQVINPITGQRCAKGRLCSCGSWQVRYNHERREKTGCYMWKRGTNGLPGGLSKARQEKKDSMTASSLGSQSIPWYSVFTDMPD